jgi:hypothetical protein
MRKLRFPERSFEVKTLNLPTSSGVPRNFVRVRGEGEGRGVQPIQLRTEGRENGDLGAVASIFSRNHFISER